MNEEVVAVNVEEIMQGIRKQLRMESDLESMPVFQDIPIRGCDMHAVNEGDAAQLEKDEIEAAMENINSSHSILYYWEFTGNRLKVFLKRVVRRLAKCLLLPIVEKQNELNANLVCCINNLHRENRELSDRLLKLEQTTAEYREMLLRCQEMLDKSSMPESTGENAAPAIPLEEHERDGNKGESEEECKRDIFRDNQLHVARIQANPETQIEPAFSKPDVAILLVASDSYTHYIGTLIQSIIENASNIRTYDIIVFVTDMGIQNMNMLHNMVGALGNVSLRFVDVRNALDIGKLQISNSAYSYYTLLRLLAPDLLAKYKKVLYLDADVIADADVAELFDIDVKGYCLAGAADPFINARMTYENEDRSYLESIGLTLSWGYMQAGVILFNIEQLRNEFSPFYFVKLAYEKEFHWLDQDILNVCCKGKIRFIDGCWNVFALNQDLAEKLENILPDTLYEDYTKARGETKIVHYVFQQFPDKNPNGDMAEVFWKYMRHTPFYERFLKC